MTQSWRINVFGVRHLSPSGAWHLRRYLDQIKPKLVLIEGLSDAAELIPDITRKATKPPIAILAYTDSLPVRTLVYPLARYSPEYQALSWAEEQGVAVDFIDLPSDIFLALQDVEEELLQKRRKKGAENREEGGAEETKLEAERMADPSVEPPISIYQEYAQRAGEKVHRPRRQHRQRDIALERDGGRRRNRPVAAAGEQDLRAFSGHLQCSNQLRTADNAGIERMTMRREDLRRAPHEGIHVHRAERTAVAVEHTNDMHRLAADLPLQRDE
jgi:hypothetical protein